ncbi:MAG: RraA family protein [Erythrobacter sp.]|uniref:RraA family protein n=1 Tax=Erythrobacter sp. TaxID=1042 RepID=UPI003A8C23BC
MKGAIDTSLLALLRRYDTPTICNAIEMVHGKRGFAGFTRTTVMASQPAAMPIVGFARTASLRASEPPSASPLEVRAKRMDYFRSMAEGPRPAVAVVGDLDYPNFVGAWWGEVHSVVHKGLKLEGALTNGLMRDLGEMDPDFPVLAGGIGPSHYFVHVAAIGEPVDLFGLTVRQDDLIHADRHGAIVIPPDVLPELADAIVKPLVTENLILGPARQPDFDFAKLEEAWGVFETPE